MYPKTAIKNGIQGRVNIEFIVELDGTFTEIKIINSLEYGCDLEVIRLVKNMPNWNPGKQRERKVRVRYKLPVDFIFDKRAQFPGGEDDLFTYINSELKYPKIAKKNNTKGQVLIQFLIETDGSINNVTIFRGIGDGCEEEAIRIVNKMPKWIPAEHEEKKVKSTRLIPFNFGID